MLGVSACSRSPEINDALSPRDLTSVLYVENRHWDTIRIYFLPDNGSSSVRVGAVGGSSSQTIEVKGQFAASILSRGRVRLLLRPLASRRSFVTAPVVVSPGEDLQLFVETQLDMSYTVPVG